MIADALSIPCPTCKARVGEKCRDYRGVNKATCPARDGRAQKGRAKRATESKQRGLFDNLEEPKQ